MSTLFACSVMATRMRPSTAVELAVRIVDIVVTDRKARNGLDAHDHDSLTPSYLRFVPGVMVNREPPRSWFSCMVCPFSRARMCRLPRGRASTSLAGDAG